MTGERVTRSAAETAALGEALADAMAIGDVVLLVGPLGAGKTCFVTGLARGLACKARVRSPTFGLVHEYRGRIPLAHVDLYRLEPAEAERLGLEESAEHAVLAVEWGEKLPPRWAKEALRLELTPGALAEERSIVASAAGERGMELLDAWQALARPTGGRAGAR